MKTPKNIPVRLPKKDWSDLVNFIVGDLHCMEEGEIKQQMRRICDTIRAAIIARATPPADQKGT